MVSPEPGRSSSSPSVRVEKLIHRKGRRPGEEITVVLPDASSFFVAMRVWEDDPFHEGDELDSQRWESILARSSLIRARSTAVALLARSEHSRTGLRAKLLGRGFNAGAADEVLGELARQGALSDRRFAEGWVRSRLRSRPEGRSHLVAGLRSRGIDAELAEHTVRTVLADESVSMVDQARACVERLTRRRPVSADRIRVSLYRRGFDLAVIRQVIAELASGDTDVFPDGRSFGDD